MPWTLGHPVCLQVAFPLAGGAAFVLSGEAGLLLPWGSKWQGSTSISDRFFLGGIGSGALRGFKQKGVGPTDLRRPALREEVGGEGFLAQLPACCEEGTRKAVAVAGQMYGTV